MRLWVRLVLFLAFQVVLGALVSGTFGATPRESDQVGDATGPALFVIGAGIFLALVAQADGSFPMGFHWLAIGSAVVLLVLLPDQLLRVYRETQLTVVQATVTRSDLLGSGAQDLDVRLPDGSIGSTRFIVDAPLTNDLIEVLADPRGWTHPLEPRQGAGSANPLLLLIALQAGAVAEVEAFSALRRAKGLYRTRSIWHD